MPFGDNLSGAKLCRQISENRVLNIHSWRRKNKSLLLVYAGKSKIILSLVLCSPFLGPGQWLKLDGEVFAAVLAAPGFSRFWMMLRVTWKTTGSDKRPGWPCSCHLNQRQIGCTEQVEQMPAVTRESSSKTFPEWLILQAGLRPYHRYCKPLEACLQLCHYTEHRI